MHPYVGAVTMPLLIRRVPFFGNQFAASNKRLVWYDIMAKNEEDTIMDKEELDRILLAANSPKHELIRIEGKLRDIGANKKADDLSEIIGLLESWQNQ